MKRAHLLAALLICCLTTPLWAITPDKGEQARDWGSSQWISSPPQFYSIQELIGEVAVIVHFDLNNEASNQVLKDMQALAAQHDGLGLWAFGFEKNRAQRDAVTAKMRELGVTFYISAGGGERYRGDALPTGWVVGVDGKVVYAGDATSSSFLREAEKELKKIKYPGLRIPEVHRDAEKAAKEFVKGDYTKALEEAEKTANDDKANMDARDQARMIAERIRMIHSQRVQRAQGLATEGNKDGAKAQYEWIIEKWGKRSNEGKQAADAIKQLEAGGSPSSQDPGAGGNDPAREREAEVAAAEILRKANNDRGFDVTGAVREFLQKYDGTKAAEEMRTRMKAAGIDVDGGNGGSAGPTPDESTCGGATPEEAAERVLKAWKDHNTDDLTWCTRPGPMRDGVARDPNFIVTCLNVRRYKALRVWIKDDNAWVEYEWTCRFDDNRFFEDMMKNVPPNVPREQAEPMARERTKQMKDMIEKRTHIMGLIKVGDRWYANNQPFYDQEPQFPPTRRAR